MDFYVLARIYTSQYLSHNLQLVVRRPAHLRKTETPFNTLEILASDLVAEDMRLLVAGVELFASRPFVNTNHGDTDGPSTISLACILPVRKE